MNLLTELDAQPPALISAQLLLMGIFLTAYVSAVTSLLGPRGRLRSAALALLSAISLCVVFTPWTLGVLFAAGSAAAIGVFIGASWVLSRALGVHDHAPTLQPELEAEPAEAVPVLLTLASTERVERAERGGFAPPSAPAPLG